MEALSTIEVFYVKCQLGNEGYPILVVFLCQIWRGIKKLFLARFLPTAVFSDI